MLEWGEGVSFAGMPPPRNQPRVAEIKRVIDAEFRLPKEALDSDSRRHAWAHPRQIAMYLCRDMTTYSFPQIGRLFGNRDHTTALYAYRKVKERAAKSEKFAEGLEVLRVKVRAEVERRPPGAMLHVFPVAFEESVST